MTRLVVLFSLLCGAISTSFANSIEGYWKAIDDRTGQAVSLIAIKKMPDGTFGGTMMYRYPLVNGSTPSICAKCPQPYTNKPLIGLQVVKSFIQNPKKPLEYIQGKVLETDTGRIFSDKGTLSADGRRLRLNGFVDQSIAGRNQVWIRINIPYVEIMNN